MVRVKAPDKIELLEAIINKKIDLILSIIDYFKGQGITVGDPIEIAFTSVSSLPGSLQKLLLVLDEIVKKKTGKELCGTAQEHKERAPFDDSRKIHLFPLAVAIFTRDEDIIKLFLEEGAIVDPEYQVKPNAIDILPRDILRTLSLEVNQNQNIYMQIMNSASIQRGEGGVFKDGAQQHSGQNPSTTKNTGVSGTAVGQAGRTQTVR